DPLHIREGTDRAAIDRLHNVARLEASSGRRRIGLNRIDPRQSALASVEHGRRRKDHDRQDEIGQRTGNHDSGSWPHVLMNEAALALLFGHRCGGLMVRNTGSVLITEELDVAAEWNRRHLPPRTVTVVESEQLRAETEGEDQDAHATP